MDVVFWSFIFIPSESDSVWRYMWITQRPRINIMRCTENGVRPYHVGPDLAGVEGSMVQMGWQYLHPSSPPPSPLDRPHLARRGEGSMVFMGWPYLPSWIGRSGRGTPSLPSLLMNRIIDTRENMTYLRTTYVVGINFRPVWTQFWRLNVTGVKKKCNAR